MSEVAVAAVVVPVAIEVVQDLIKLAEEVHQQKAAQVAASAANHQRLLDDQTRLQTIIDQLNASLTK